MCSSMDSSFIVHIPSKESVSLLNLDHSRKRYSFQGWKPLSVCGINSSQNYKRNMKVFIIFQGVFLFVRVELCNRFLLVDLKMSQEHHVRKENALLKRGIFSTSDFEAFQKSEVKHFTSMKFYRQWHNWGSSWWFALRQWEERRYPILLSFPTYSICASYNK